MRALLRDLGRKPTKSDNWLGGESKAMDKN